MSGLLTDVVIQQQDTMFVARGRVPPNISRFSRLNRVDNLAPLTEFDRTHATAAGINLP